MPRHGECGHLPPRSCLWLPHSTRYCTISRVPGILVRRCRVRCIDTSGMLNGTTYLRRRQCLLAGMYSRLAVRDLQLILVAFLWYLGWTPQLALSAIFHILPWLCAAAFGIIAFSSLWRKPPSSFFPRDLYRCWHLLRLVAAELLIAGTPPPPVLR